MKLKPSSSTWWRSLTAAVGTVLLSGTSGFAGDWMDRPTIVDRPSLIPADLDWRTVSDGNTGRGPRFYSFRTPSGAFSDILIRSDADADAGTDPALRASKDDDPNDPRINVILSADNPFFDFRLPGDLGGVGYHRLYTEFALLQTQSACLSLNCHAVTPAGLESEGLADGATQFAPALTYSQDLGICALQGFVSRTCRAQMHDLDPTTPRNVEYGMVLQQPMPGLDNLSGPKVFLFLETLGRYRYDEGTAAPQPAARWDLLPGVHFRGGDNWWLSGGVMVPLNTTTKSETGLWQVTCAWQY